MELNTSIMKAKIFNTSDSYAPLFIRLMLGLVVFPHGAQKLFAWFGGYGFSGTMTYFTDTMGLPWLIAFLVILLEAIGALALIAGLATRLIAISYLFLALGILFTSHLQNGFFMNWYGNQQGEGYEYFLLWIGMALSLILTGAGKYSIDNDLLSKKSRP
jgi:putative oxidoreductase